MTTLSLGTEFGLSKNAKFVTMECNDEQKFIRVFYREQLVSTDGTIVKNGDILSYELRDKPAILHTTGEIITPAVITNGVETTPAVISNGTEIKVPAVNDFTDWDTQLGTPVIRPAIVNRLKLIFGIV
jgi:hypothetical protein